MRGRGGVRWRNKNEGHGWSGAEEVVSVVTGLLRALAIFNGVIVWVY